MKRISIESLISQAVQSIEASKNALQPVEDEKNSEAYKQGQAAARRAFDEMIARRDNAVSNERKLSPVLSGVNESTILNRK